jgi:hypothetical protein
VRNTTTSFGQKEAGIEVFVFDRVSSICKDLWRSIILCLLDSLKRNRRVSLTQGEEVEKSCSGLSTRGSIGSESASYDDHIPT